jgi:hypothetical protein
LNNRHPLQDHVQSTREMKTLAKQMDHEDKRAKRRASQHRHSSSLTSLSGLSNHSSTSAAKYATPAPASASPAPLETSSPPLHPKT